MFPRLYADVIIAYAPNSPEAKILAQNYKKIVAYTERTNQLMSNVKSCTHIKVSGVRCGSPLSAESSSATSTSACFAPSVIPPRASTTPPSSRTRSPSRSPSWKSSTPCCAAPSNSSAPNSSSAPSTPPSATSAASNSALHSDEMVREIPDYPTPPLEQVDEQYAAELRRQEKHAEAARVPKGRSPGRILRWRRQNPRTPEKTHNPPRPPASVPYPQECGDSRPRLSRRPRSTGPQRTATEASPSRSSRSNPQAPSKCERSSRSRKTQAAAARAEAPKERKSAAHRASGG